MARDRFQFSLLITMAEAFAGADSRLPATCRFGRLVLTDLPRRAALNADATDLRKRGCRAPKIGMRPMFWADILMVAAGNDAMRRRA